MGLGVIYFISVGPESAINSSSFTVDFNQKVNATSAKDLKNYHLGIKNSSTGTIESNSLDTLTTAGKWIPTLSADGKSVTFTTPSVTVAATAKSLFNVEGETFAAATHLIKRGEIASFEVRNVKSDAGKLMSTQALEITADDKLAPKITKSEVTASPNATAFDVDLSEAVKITTDTKVYLNGLDVTAKTAVGGTTVALASTLKLTALSPLTAGNHELTIVGLEDLNGNVVSPNPAKVTVKVAAVSNVAPKVLSANQTTDNTLRIVFDKSIEVGAGVAAELVFKNLNGTTDVKVDLATGEVGGAVTDLEKGVKVISNNLAVVDAAGKTTGYAFDVEFTDLATDAGGVFATSTAINRTIEVANHAVKIDPSGAASGSNLAFGERSSKVVTLKKDFVAPVATGASIVKLDYLTTNIGLANTIQIAFKDEPFNQGIVLGTGNVTTKLTLNGVTSTVTFDSADGKIILANGTKGATVVATPFAAAKVKSADTLNNALNITLDVTKDEVKNFFDSKGNLKPGATIQVELPNGIVTDDITKKITQTAIRNVAQSLTVKVPGSAVEESAPQTNVNSIIFDQGANRIAVQFYGDDIDPATATNKANYTLSGSALPAGATVEYEEKDDATKTKFAYINLPQNTIEFAGNYVFNVSGVATKSSGAKMLPVSKTVALADNTQPVLKSLDVLGTNEVVLTFSEAVTVGGNGALAGDNFIVFQGNTAFTVATVADGAPSAPNKLKLTLAANNLLDITKIDAVSIQANASGDVYVTDIANNKAKVGITINK